jgi:hypothetical protein
MILLVSDTSILIDLERGGLLEAAFSCGWTMIVPDLLYERELLSENGPYLRSLGLGVVELSPDEVSFAQKVKRDRSALSLADCFALTCAQRANHVLLSGDKVLREEAQTRNGVVYGVLWLLDQMHAANIAPASLFDGLTKIGAHPRCRLPKDEVHNRLKRWRPSTPEAS